MSITVMKLALEALETYHGYMEPLLTVFGGPRVPAEQSTTSKVEKAITAIKQSLAAPTQEPVAIHCKAKRENNGVCPNHNLQCGWPKCNEPPVAHVQKLADCCANCLRPEHEHQEGKCPKPFTTIWHAWDYDFPPAAQREWVGLNWDDLPEIYVGDTAFMHGAKWAEAKLKEKNNGQR
jgi:hypothetical protein